MTEQGPEEYYTQEIQDSLRANEHYLDKVTKLKGANPHEQARHRANLTLNGDRLKAWLNSEKTDQVAEWRKVAKLQRDTAYLVGLSAVWLASCTKGGTLEDK